MTDDLSAAGSAAPNSTTPVADSAAKPVEKTSTATATVQSAETPTPADDFDENLITPAARENFRKYRESQTAKSKELQDKYNQEIRQRYEAEARAKHFEQQLTPKEKKELGPKPDYHNFKTIEEFEKACEEYYEGRGVEKYTQHQTQAETQRAMQVQAAKLQAKGQAAAQKYPDFAQVIKPFIRVADQIPGLSNFVLESDSGQDVFYELCKNPTLLEALKNMSPVSRAKELFRMEAAMSASPAKAVSKAPNPMNPVNTGGDGNVKSILDLVKKEDASDFVARENRKLIRGKKGE